MAAAVRFPFLCLTLLWSLLTFGAAGQVTFRTEVLYDVVGVNTAFQVQYSLENAGQLVDMRLQPALPFSPVGSYADAQRTSTQIHNGAARTTHTYTRTYTLRASQTGLFALPVAIAQTADGKTYRSDPVRVEVVTGNPRKTPGSSGTDPFGDPFAGGDPFGPDPFGGNDPFGPGSPLDRIADAFRREARLPTAAEIPKLAFLEIAPQKRTAYEGEPIIVEYLLVSGITVSGNLTKMPAPDGFWVQEISGDKEERGNRRVGDKMFQTLLIKRVALIPQRTGSLTIAPAEMQAVGTIDDGYGNPQQHSWMIKSTPVTLQIRPLPAGKPADFNGAVGSYQINASLEPPTMPRNGASALRLTVSGAGNLAQLDAPKLFLPQGLAAETPVVKDDFETDGRQLTGSRTFTYPLTAAEEGHFELPAVRFPFFNPQTDRYEEAQTAPLTLTVTAAEALAGTDEPVSQHPLLLPGIFAVIALVAGILLWRRTKSRPKPTAAPAPPSAPAPADAAPEAAVAAAVSPPTPETFPPATVREVLAVLEQLLLEKTGRPASALSVQDLSENGLDAIAAQRVMLFRQKAESTLYGGLPADAEDLMAEGTALLAALRSWQPPKVF